MHFVRLYHRAGKRRIEIRGKAWDEDHVELTGALNPVGDMNIAALRVMRLWDHTTSECLSACAPAQVCGPLQSPLPVSHVHAELERIFALSE